MKDFPSSVPKFNTKQTEWTCWVSDNGNRYEWRSRCGRLCVSRSGRGWFAWLDGEEAGEPLPSLKIAMLELERLLQRKKKYSHEGEKIALPA